MFSIPAPTVFFFTFHKKYFSREKDVSKLNKLNIRSSRKFQKFPIISKCEKWYSSRSQRDEGPLIVISSSLSTNWAKKNPGYPKFRSDPIWAGGPSWDFEKFWKKVFSKRNLLNEVSVYVSLSFFKKKYVSEC